VLTWRPATVVATRAETPGVRSIDVEVDGWEGSRPGQHVDVRLTADDGYQARRSYSIASAPGAGRLTLTVEKIGDGEVSPWFVDELRVGDDFDLRGPIGGWFVWDPADGGPLLLVAGGSGIVPLAAMLRHRAAVGDATPTRLLYSSRTADDIIYRAELDDLGVEVVHTLTRGRPPGWTGFTRRIDAAMVAEVAWPAADRPLAYVCGPTRLVETVANGLVGLGYEPGRVKTERFGPTGG